MANSGGPLWVPSIGNIVVSSSGKICGNSWSSFRLLSEAQWEDPSYLLASTPEILENSLRVPQKLVAVISENLLRIPSELQVPSETCC